MTQILTQSLIPIFVGLLFGYAAGWMKVVNNENPKELVTFLMSFALPCTLFVTIALRTHANIAAIFGLVYIVTFLATYCVARFFQKDTADESAVVALTLGFPNLAGVGLPLLAALYGAGGNVSLVVGLAVGAVTITPIALAILKSSSTAGGDRLHVEIIRTAIWRALEKPAFGAPMAGVVRCF
jgi:malonate transporter